MRASKINRYTHATSLKETVQNWKENANYCPKCKVKSLGNVCPYCGIWIGKEPPDEETAHYMSLKRLPYKKAEYAHDAALFVFMFMFGFGGFGLFSLYIGLTMDIKAIPFGIGFTAIAIVTVISFIKTIIASRNVDNSSETIHGTIHHWYSTKNSKGRYSGEAMVVIANTEYGEGKIVYHTGQRDRMYKEGQTVYFRKWKDYIRLIEE